MQRKNRRIQPLLFVAALILSCTSCGRAETESPETPITIEAATKAPDSGFDSGFCEKAQDENHFGSVFTTTEDALYFISGMDLGIPNQLMYVDKKSGVSGPLCGKAECTHSGDDCNATFGSGGRIYALSKYGEEQLILLCEQAEQDDPNALAVILVRQDGTERRQLRTIPDPWEGSARLNTWAMLHRGYAVIGGVRQTVEDGEMENIAFVKAYPVDGGEAVTVYEGTPNPQPNGRVALQAVGDEVHFFDSESASSEETDSDEPQLIAGKWNLQTKKTQRIYEGAFLLYVWDTRVEGTDILLSGLGALEICRLSTADGSVSEAFIFPDSENSAPVASFTSEGAVVYYYPDSPDCSKRRIILSDYSGNPSHKHEEAEDLITYKDTAFTRTFCGCVDGELYYYFCGKTGEKTQRRCLRAISVETGVVKTLWEEEVPGL